MLTWREVLVAYGVITMLTLMWFRACEATELTSPYYSANKATKEHCK